MEILWFVVVGAVIGAVARLLMPGRDALGILGTIVIGIIGAVVGGYLFREVFGNTEGVEWIGAIAFAMVTLYLYRRFAADRGTF